MRMLTTKQNMIYCFMRVRLLITNVTQLNGAN